MPWASLNKIIIAKGNGKMSGMMAAWASGTGVARGVCGICILVPSKEFRWCPGVSRAWTKCGRPMSGQHWAPKTEARPEQGEIEAEKGESIVACEKENFSFQILFHKGLNLSKENIYFYNKLFKS